MRNDEVRDTLLTIFETGLFYNASILANKEQIRVFSYLEDILLTGNDQSRITVLESVNNQYIEHRNDLRKSITIPTEYYDQQCKINTILNYINSYLNLPWHLSLLLVGNREANNTKILLSKYLEVSRITKGFKCFDSKILREIIEEFGFIKKIREEKLFILGRTSLSFDETGKFISIYYDDKKTSFRQALKNSIALYGDSDGLRYFDKAKQYSGFKSIGRLLIALDYSARKDEYKGIKQGYFNEMISQYQTEIGFTEERTLSRALVNLDEYLNAIKSFYEINIQDIDSEQRYRKNFSKMNKESHVDVKILISTALTTYINYFSCIIANKVFFQDLQKLKSMICDDLKNDSELSLNEIEYHACMILNFINDDLKVEMPKFDIYYSESFRVKYKKEILNLRRNSIFLNLWSCYLFNDFIPTISELIQAVNALNKAGIKNLDEVKQEDLDSLSVKFDFNKVMMIRKALPIKSKGATAGFRLGNPAMIIPMSDSSNLSETFQFALNLFDNDARRIYLYENAISNKLKAYDSLLLGLYYFYEKEWKDLNISDKKCVDELSILCGKVISNSRLRSGKAQALNLISTFTPNQAS